MNWNDYLFYDQITGKITWKVKRHGPNSSIGGEVGSIKSDGRYRTFVIFQKRYYVHRVAWEMVNGIIPKGMCIDHIDGNGLNNCLINLRVTTLSGNQRNRRISKNNRTGVCGVNHHANGYSVYCANKYVGHFQKFEDAVVARRKAEKENDYHPTHGRK